MRYQQLLCCVCNLSLQHSPRSHVYLRPCNNMTAIFTNWCWDICTETWSLETLLRHYFVSPSFVFSSGARRQSVSARTTLHILWRTKIILPCSSWNGYQHIVKQAFVATGICVYIYKYISVRWHCNNRETEEHPLQNSRPVLCYHILVSAKYGVIDSSAENIKIKNLCREGNTELPCSSFFFYRQHLKSHNEDKLLMKTRTVITNSALLSTCFLSSRYIFKMFHVSVYCEHERRGREKGFCV